MHPFVAAELALGSLRDRLVTLDFLERLPQVRVATLHEVRRMIELRSLTAMESGSLTPTYWRLH